MRGMLMEIDMTWKMSVPKLMIESHSKVLVVVVIGAENLLVSTPTLVRRIHKLFSIN